MQMNIIKNIAFFLTGLAAWVIIVISDRKLEIDNWPVSEVYTFAALLLGSVIYLQWALRAYLVPRKQLSQHHAEKLQAAISTYTKCHSAGCISTGYFFLALHTLSILNRATPIPPTFLSLALFFITLGTLAKARAAVKFLCREFETKEMKTIEHAPPEGRGEAPRP